MRRYLFIIALLVIRVASAKGQNTFEVVVDAPAGLNQVSIPFGIPDLNWGFGNIYNFTPPITGTVKRVTLPDSFACAPLPAGSLQGRIGLAHRGTCDVGVKALNMQNAGAVGFVIVNNVCGGRIWSGHNGVRIDIPGILIEKCFYETQLRQLVQDTALRLSMGNFFGFYGNNLTIKRSTVVAPPATAIPYYMITDTNSFWFRPGGRVINKGSQSSGATKLKAIITQERFAAPGIHNIVYTDSIVFSGSVPQGDTAPSGSQFVQLTSWYPGKGLAPNTPIDGVYRLTYRASNMGPDGAPFDNEVSYEFDITAWGQDAPYSLARVDRNRRYTPLFSTALSGPGGGPFQSGITLYTPNIPANTIKVDSMMFAVSGAISNTTLNLDMWRWNDANQDNLIATNELTPLGSGSYTFVDAATESNRFVSAPLVNIATGTIGIPLASNAQYLFMVNHSSGNQLFLAYDDFQDYTLTLEQSGRIGSPVFVSRWITTGLGTHITPSIRLSLSDSRDPTRTPLRPLSARARASKLGVSVFPNPTTGASALRVGSLTGAISISITDITGKVVETIRRSVVANQTVDLNTARLAPGTYNMSVRSAQGSTVTPLIITR